MSEYINSAADLLRIANEIYSKIAGEKNVAIMLDCASNLATYTITIKADNRFSKWVMGMGKNEFKFPTSKTYNVRVTELKPFYGEIEDAVTRTETEIIVDFKKCLSKDQVRLQVQYFMREGFADSLVHWRSSPEPLVNEMKYELSAQLVDPEKLEYDEVFVQDYPVTTRVYVKDSLNVKIPGLATFKELRRLESDMFSDYKPGDGFKIAGMQRARYELREQLREENPRELLGALNRLLLPAHFREYLELEEHKDYKYFGQHWFGGREMPGNVILPDEVLVIHRTDLSLKKKATHDVLHYHRRKFEDDVQDALSKHANSK